MWRQKSSASHPDEADLPTIHLRDPNKPLPGLDDYRNPSFYVFLPSHASASAAEDGLTRTRSLRSARTDKSTRSKKTAKTNEEGNKEPAFRKAFDKFHSENGVRTVTGSIGPIGNVRMLLKNGYRHVYMSRKFAVKHGFVPKDASLGYYGYSGLIKCVLFSGVTGYPLSLFFQYRHLANQVVRPQRSRGTRTVPRLNLTHCVPLGRTAFRRHFGSIIYGETTGPI